MPLDSHAVLRRAIFESAEKLEAVSAVREHENLQRADNPTEPSGVLQDVVFDAGHTCASQVRNYRLATHGLDKPRVVSMCMTTCS